MILFFFRLYLQRGIEWVLILPRPTQQDSANNVFTKSHLGMAEPGFEPTTLWLDIWANFELHILAAQVRATPS